MDALQEYPWPGNIRELRNVIEHAVILSPGDVLDVRVPKTKGVERSQSLPAGNGASTHSGSSRTHGVADQRAGGAAEKLGMKPATLYSMMNRLGISSAR